METPSSFCGPNEGRASLETSLVEWKHVARTAPARSGGALETSLVEWKLAIWMCFWYIPVSLGNFLSGMETVGGVVRLQEHLALETSLVEWKHEKWRAVCWSPEQPWKLP